MRVSQYLDSTESPVASIFINTYNHSAYIEECLSSILIQEVNFPCEIIIFDDASTDNTISIIDSILGDRRLVKKIYRAENIQSKSHPEKRRILANVFANLDTKVFFWLDGDDYWIGSPNRIQMMTERILNNSSLSMCYTDTFKDTSEMEEGNESSGFLLPQVMKNGVSVPNLLLGNYSYIHLGASCFRVIE